MVTATPSKILIIGFELGDGPLLKSWAHAGRLPALQALLEGGCHGELATPADRLHISAWPSLYTGATPGEHGVYFTFQPAPGLQGYRRFHPGLYGRPSFWQRLDAAGRRCIVLDPPYTHPEENFRGLYVHDWGTWAHYLKTGARPDGLLRQLERCCGRYPLGLEANDLGLAPLDPAELEPKLLRAIEAKAEATRWLMGRADWDLLFTVFGETHVAGHYCWTPEVPRALRGADGGAGVDGGEALARLLRLYQALDRAVAAIQAAAGPDALTVVITGDSIGVNHAGWHLLPEVLKRLGYLAEPDAAAAGGAGGGAGPGLNPVKWLRDLLPKDLRKNLARRLPTALRDKLAQQVDAGHIDWARTRAYCLPTDLEGYIRLNLKGREPQGLIAPGAEYESALTDLTQALMALRDPISQQPIVREVLRADREFPGARREHLPDLIVLWDTAAPITAAASERIGVVSAISPDPRTGTHRGPGFVCAAGPGITPGTVLEQGDILDFAPSLLARAGLAPPQGLPGRVWPGFASFTKRSAIA